VISPTTKPVTDSLKVAVMGTGEALVGEVAVEVSISVGGETSPPPPQEERSMADRRIIARTDLPFFMASLLGSVITGTAGIPLG